MTSNPSDTSFAFSTDNETSIPTVDDMEGQKDKTDKYMWPWYCEITKECYLIYKECQVQSRVFCNSTFHTHHAYILRMLFLLNKFR